MKNAILIFGAGVVAGYILDKVMTPTAAVKGVSLACNCANGTRCNSGHSDCSCCPGKRGTMAYSSNRYVLPPVPYQITTGI
jgi:hypothetical protein